MTRYIVYQHAATALIGVMHLLHQHCALTRRCTKCSAPWCDRVIKPMKQSQSHVCMDCRVLHGMQDGYWVTNQQLADGFLLATCVNCTMSYLHAHKAVLGTLHQKVEDKKKRHRPQLQHGAKRTLIKPHASRVYKSTTAQVRLLPSAYWIPSGIWSTAVILLNLIQDVGWWGSASVDGFPER
jgi:hypothetical protein